jgi:hypothetical protein
MPSVTTVIDLANFDDKGRRMSWSAAEKAAVAAVHYTQDWWDKASTLAKGKPCHQDHNLCAICDRKKQEHAPEDGHRFVPGLCAACNYLRTRFHYDTERKKHLGSHLHHLALSWAQGEGIESDDVVDPYLDGLEAWYEVYHPAWQYLERTIYYEKGPRLYVGTFDALAELDCPACAGNRCHWLLDIKTGLGQWDKEWALQLAAYRFADSLTLWEGGKQQVASKMPLVAHTGVIWLHDTGRAELVPVHTGGEEHNQFLRLLDVYNWARQTDKRIAELAAVEAEDEEDKVGATV